MRPFPPVAAPSMMVTSPLVVLLWATLLIISASPCAAQQGPQWVHFDESPDGTPATVELMENDSSSQLTRFILTIHGFWIEPLVGPDQRLYRRYVFPGLGQIDAEGAPELPRFVFRIAVPTTAQEFSLQLADIVDQRIYQNILPYPTPKQATEDVPEEWRYDQKLYEGTERYPAEVLDAAPPMTKFLNTIVGGDLEIFPVQWNPVTQELRIIHIIDVAYAHTGAILNDGEMTRHRARMAGSLFDNWPIVEEYFPVNGDEYIGNFLFVYRAALGAAIRPLVNQKRARGFHTEELTTEDIGDTCEEIRTAISNWLDGQSPWGDSYVLLVGDHAELPMCGVTTDTGGIIYSDDKYGSPRDGDLNEEVFVGRLSVNGAVDLTQQVTKILRYEDTGSYFGDYREALLVAHHEDAPGRYRANCEEIRTAAYANPPIFLTCYGSDGGTNADIELAVEQELGVVTYRGHGNGFGWGNWNTPSESYLVAQLADLDNGFVTPVVWSLTCQSGDMLREDCFTEELMMGSEDRAVAAYGATENSGFESNNWIGKTLFEAVYDDNIVIHSHAIMVAEETATRETSNWNEYVYYLLGDPEMHIRRRAPADMVIMAPETVPLCTAPPCWLDAQVMDAQGQPLPELIVSAWMPSPHTKGSAAVDTWKMQPPTGGVLSNRYSDVEGKVHLPAEPGGEGWILLTARDDFGRVLSDSVRVVTGTATPVGQSSLILSPQPAIMTDRTTFHFGRALQSAYRLEIYDQRGRLVRRLRGEEGPDRLLWDGRDDGGDVVGSGVYLVRLIAEQRRLSTKVVRMR